MQLITKADILQNLSKRYKSQYPTSRILADGRDTDNVISMLNAEENLTEKRACEIIGYKSWTENVCDECKKDKYALVMIGEQPNHDSNTASICFDCLNKAVLLNTFPPTLTNT